MAAFKDAGARKRRMTNEADEDFEKERRAEVERQKVRQERIRDRIPGRRVTGKAKAGDIDGKSFSQRNKYTVPGFGKLATKSLCTFTAVLDEIKDEWEFVIDPDVRT